MVMANLEDMMLPFAGCSARVNEEEILKKIENYCQSNCPLSPYGYDCVYSNRLKCKHLREYHIIPREIRDIRHFKEDDLFDKAISEIRDQKVYKELELEEKRIQEETQNIIQQYCSGNSNSVKASILIDNCNCNWDYPISESLLSFLHDPQIDIENVFQYGENAFYVFKRIASKKETELKSADVQQHFSSDRLLGIVDDTGKVLFQPTYLSISQFVGDVIIVRNQAEKFGLISLSGQIILNCDFEKIYPYSELVFGVCQNGKIGFMDITGKEIIPFNYIPDNNDVVFSNGLACVLEKEGYVYIDHQGKQYFDDHYKYHVDFNGCLRISNSTVNDFVSHYRVDEYYLYLNGNTCFVDSDYIEKDLEIEDNNDYSQEPTTDSDVLDAYEGDVSARWNTD